MTLEVRPARPEDVADCIAMMHVSSPWRELGYDRRRCASLLSAGRDEMRVAADRDDRPRGFLLYQPTGFIGQPYVKLLCVAEDARGHGIGRTLVEWAEAETFERRGALNLFLLVSDFNRTARDFYARLGFAEVGRLPEYLVAGADEMILRKTRGPLLGGSRVEG